MTPPIDRRLYLKSLKTIFSKNSQFRDIINEVKLLSNAKKVIERALPKQIAQHIAAYSYKNGRLVLSVPNSSILSQARFYVPDLLQAFKGEVVYRDLKKIHLKVSLGKHSEKPNSSKNPPLSAANREMLLDTANTLEEGPLKKALKKLASHTSS